MTRRSHVSYDLCFCHGVFSRALRMMGEPGDFRFHPQCKQLKLNHLIFADDLMIFCKAQKKSIERILETLEYFHKNPGT